MNAFDPHPTWQAVIASAEPWQRQVQAALNHGLAAGWTPPPLWQTVLNTPPPWMANVRAAMGPPAPATPANALTPLSGSWNG